MQNSLRRPKGLENGDKVALIAPSSPHFYPERVDIAAGHLEKMGFKVVIGESCRSAYGYLAGSDTVRANDINKSFADALISGIFCLRGGYGAQRILDMIDFETITQNPKFFSGYSDITALHVAINQKSGLMTFHTPMAGEKNFGILDPYTKRYLNWCMHGEEMGINLENPAEYKWEFLTQGSAEGILCGGNLSVIASLMGTPYELDTAGKIIFLEDIGEKPYRIDRMLNQLRLGEKFAHCAAIIFGDFADCTADNPTKSFAIPEIIRNLNLNPSIPVLYNLRCGHCLPTASLPMGSFVKLNSKNGYIYLNM